MIYVMSDIHGYEARFRSIMNQIRLNENDHLYVLGDCIDRHPYGLEILKDLYYMSNVTVLLGNHEYMMLQALGEDRIYNPFMQRWFGNGAHPTYYAWLRYSIEQRDELIEIIRHLPISVEVCCAGKEYLLVHGAPIGYKRITDDPVESAVWTRLDQYTRLPYEQTVIFGHTPTDYYQVGKPMRIFYGNKMIGVDCGCAYQDGGRLACLRLDDMKEFYSEDYSIPDEASDDLQWKKKNM